MRVFSPLLEAKIAKIKKKYHDLIDAMVDLRGLKVNRFKMILWVWPTSVLKARAWMVVDVQVCFPFCQKQKLQKPKGIS
jgi:hypothetical protein